MKGTKLFSKNKDNYVVDNNNDVNGENNVRKGDKKVLSGDGNVSVSSSILRCDW